MNMTQMTDLPEKKPKGWKGRVGDRFWTKNLAAGVRYKCSSCGREQLGLYNGGNDPKHHWKGCSRLMGADNAR
jgi:hypothetical protein